MPLKLMYITNNPEVATIVEHAGVDRIFIDMEFIGKMHVKVDWIQYRITIQYRI